MSVPVSTLVHVSALAAAVPHLTVSLDTHNGSTVIVGDFPEASLCSAMFRHVVAEWPSSGDHEPCVDAIHFDGATERGPVLASGQVRWFVSELSAQPTTAAVRASLDSAFDASCHSPRENNSHIDTHVRFDAVLGVTVVRMEAHELSAPDLDEAATLAYAACLAEHLISVAAAA